MSHLQLMEMHCSSMAAIHPKYLGHILCSSACTCCTFEILRVCYFLGIQTNITCQVSLLSIISTEKTWILSLQDTPLEAVMQCPAPHIWCVPIQEILVQNVMGIPGWNTYLKKHDWSQKLVVLYLEKQHLHLQHIFSLVSGSKEQILQPFSYRKWFRITLSSFPFAQLQLFEDAVFVNNINVSKWWQDKKVAPMQETAQSSYPYLWGAVPSDAWGSPATFSSETQQRSWESSSKSADPAGEEVQSVRNQIKNVLTKVTLLSVRTGHNPPWVPLGTWELQ